MTIGNIAKDIRRKPSRHSHVLIGYLPATRLEHITNKASQRRALANLFHSCMLRILAPLKHAGIHGLALASGDGIIRRCHPIFATYVGDYPEQLLVTGIKNGECPKCEVPRDEIGDNNAMYPLRNLENILDALSQVDETPTIYSNACKHAGIKPIYHPFWEDLPYVHIFRSITPDILHQLYQGVMKHIIAWLKSAYGTAEIDARCNHLPPNHNIRLFTKGISTLSRVTGQEHNQICRFLLGIIIDIPLPGGYSAARLIRAVRAILDFLYLAQYPLHTTTTLKHLEDALDHFHENKQIFVDIGIRSNFNIPKLHSLLHYTSSIRLFGTTDNYNTEYTERLHIDLAKDAYRATNHKDKYTQMTIWLERKEKILRHEKYIQWRLTNQLSQPRRLLPSIVPQRQLKMTRHPTLNAVSIESICSNYGATFFRHTLARFLVQWNNPLLSRKEIEKRSLDTYLPFCSLPVFHRIKFQVNEVGIISTADAIHVGIGDFTI